MDALSGEKLSSDQKNEFFLPVIKNNEMKKTLGTKEKNLFFNVSTLTGFKCCLNNRTASAVVMGGPVGGNERINKGNDG